MREALALMCNMVLCLSASSFVAICLCGFKVAEAQIITNFTTDSSEATALNSIFQKWGISATNQWNISGVLCSGVAVDTTDIQTLNPGIKCDCSDRNGTLCHITALRVYAKSIARPIPDELWNLTSLIDLDLRQNFLTGPLSPSIGRLTQMQFLSLGINALSGDIPKEIGLLTELRALSFTTNNFSGPLPPELGRLTKLLQFYFASSGVSGPIPSTFANLRSLEIVWGSDNALSGQIPNFIGGWSKLTNLQLQGNSFEGQIPPSFANLTSMLDLRISDLSNSNWTSSLDFPLNMRFLNILVLRNNNISGSIPSLFGALSSLAQLDLSFNNLSGRIPFSLLQSSLTRL